MRLHGTMENRDGRLWMGGIDVEALVRQYGSPLYIYDETHILRQCAAIQQAAKEYPAGMRAYYASKAFPNAAIERIVHQQGIGVDVASEGELRVAMLADVPFEDIMLHGVVKSDAYLQLAIQNGIGMIVVDSLDEIPRIEAIAAQHSVRVKALLRINPGVEAETHKAVRTADLDTKFGVPLLEGLALEAVRRMLKSPHIQLMGVHCHVGSQVFKMDVFDVAADILLSFMREAQDIGATMDILNLGGGFGSYYKEGDTPQTMEQSVRIIAKAVQAHCAKKGMPLPRLMIEPGRSIVAEAAVAVYTVSVVKDIPGVNTYVVTDGGLFENPRPQLYGSVYTPFLPLRMNEQADRAYVVSGLCCETDTLVEKAKLPSVRAGDLLALLTSGAYQAAMAGNYQRSPKPAIVLVKDGQSRLIQRRQTLDEVLALDIV